MKKKITSDAGALKRAKKCLKFWFKILLESDLMNEKEYRQEFMQTISTVNDNYKKIKKEN